MAMAELVMPRLPTQQQSATPYLQNQQYYHSQPQPLNYQVPPLPLQQQQPAQPQLVQQHPRIASGHTPPYQTPSDTSSSLSNSINNGSPVSPKAYFTRQVRPLYIPAVLRPTEFPSMPDLSQTPPKSGGDAEGDDDRPTRSSGSFIRLSQALGRLSRRSTGDSTKRPDGDWNLDLFPEVESPPTRQHWKADPTSSICDDPTCKRYFNTFNRRHHCRRCGNIFCDPHSSYEVPLDESAAYNPRGTLSRACDHCYGEFKTWRRRTREEHEAAAATAAAEEAADMGREATVTPQTLASAANLGGNGGASGSKTAPATPRTRMMSGMNGGSAGENSAAAVAAAKGAKSPAEAAASVPSNWNWSTF